MPPMTSTSQKLRRFGVFAGGLVGLYCLIYLVLSLSGQYRPVSEGGLGHWQAYSTWAPFGFYDPSHSPPGSVAAERGTIIGTWRGSMIWMFYPLWLADISYMHKTQPSGPKPSLEPR
jgi:hypothetical protein